MEKQRRGMSSGKSNGIVDTVGSDLHSSEHRYAWEYELEAYRSQKKRAKWLAIGAFCGVLSLVIEVGLHWNSVAALTKIWPFK